MKTDPTQQIWNLLEAVKDPEIPVISVVEMGIISSVRVVGKSVFIRMTPTFSGCPALHVMRAEIEQSLGQAGYEIVDVAITNDPPWTSDWITPMGREKLRSFGLAPPPKHSGMITSELLDIATCPYCFSENTSIKNSFGSTLCRAIFYCNACQQPFEQFKPV